MRILVLDTIHGGLIIARYLVSAGHDVDVVDVYRGKEGISPTQAAMHTYDLIIHPVHLDPFYPLLSGLPYPRITHHEAVRWILAREDTPPLSPFVEVTGARGKTTTAHALASLLPGPGVLHTSMGTFTYPEKNSLKKTGITPAALLDACFSQSGWCVAEVSLGCTGLGDLGIITSDETYPCANGRYDALSIKTASSLSCRSLLVAPGVKVNHKNVLSADDIVSIDGYTACYSYHGMEGSVVNPLFGLRGYAIPLMLAVAAACMLSLSPAPLSGFVPLEGRMKRCEKDGRLYIDNANSGTNRETTVDAVAYARTLFTNDSCILVIGEEAETICDGFPGPDILSVIRSTTPYGVILVHSGEYDDLVAIIAREPGIRVTHEACSLKDGIKIASAIQRNCPVVLAVKTWR